MGSTEEAIIKALEDFRASGCCSLINGHCGKDSADEDRKEEQNISFISVSEALMTLWWLLWSEGRPGTHLPSSFPGMML